MKRTLLFVVSLAIAVAMAGWVPDFQRPHWVRETLDHRCRDVTFGRTDVFRVTCNGDRVEVLHAITTSGMPTSVSARLAWSGVYSRDLVNASVQVWIAGDIVIVENERCITCNVQRGPVWLFRPAFTRPETLRSIQRAVGLPSRHARTSVTAWQRQ